MALRPVSVDGAQIANSATTYYTATNKQARVDALSLCNTTGGAITVTVYIVPSGGSADATNTVLSSYSIAAGESYVVSAAIGQWIEDGGTLRAVASSATSVTILLSVMEYTS